MELAPKTPEEKLRDAQRIQEVIEDLKTRENVTVSESIEEEIVENIKKAKEEIEKD